jgi:hypothetical protein
MKQRNNDKELKEILDSLATGATHFVSSKYRKA